MSCFPVVLLFWALSVTALPWQENETPEEDNLKRIKVQENLPSSENNGQNPGIARSLDSKQGHLAKMPSTGARDPLLPPANRRTFAALVNHRNAAMDYLRSIRIRKRTFATTRQPKDQSPTIRRLDPEVLQEYLEHYQSPDIVRRLDPEVLQEYLEHYQNPDTFLRQVPPQNPDLVLRLDPEVLQEYLRKDAQNPNIARRWDPKAMQEYLEGIQKNKPYQSPNTFLRRVPSQSPDIVRRLDPEALQEYLEHYQSPDLVLRWDPEVLQEYPEHYQSPDIVLRWDPEAMQEYLRKDAQNPNIARRWDPKAMQAYLQTDQTTQSPQVGPQNPNFRQYLDLNSLQSSLNLQTQGPGTIIRSMAFQYPGHILRRDPEVLKVNPHPTKKPQNPGHILRRDPEVLQEYRESPQRKESPPKTKVQKPGLTRLLNLEVLQDYLDCIRIQKNAPENNGRLDPKDYRKCIKFQKMSRPKDSSAVTKGQYPGLGRRQDPGVLQVNKFNRGFIKLQNTVQLPAGPYGK